MNTLNDDEAVEKTVIKQLRGRKMTDKTIIIKNSEYNGHPLITAGEHGLLSAPGDMDIQLLSGSGKQPYVVGRDSISPEGIALGTVIGISTTTLVFLLIHLYKKKQLTEFTFYCVNERKWIPVTRNMMNFFQPVVNIFTGFDESTHRLANDLMNLLWDIPDPMSKESLTNFCHVAEFLIMMMHQDARDKSYFKSHADAWFETNKGKQHLPMEAAWFQPAMHEKLVARFGQAVTREEQDVRGLIDFKIHGIPIECKVIKDGDGYPASSSGVAILERHEAQAFQHMMHVNCGMLVAYDYRIKSVVGALLVESVTERFRLKRSGDKLLMEVVFLGNMKAPSSLRTGKTWSENND